MNVFLEKMRSLNFCFVRQQGFQSPTQEEIKQIEEAISRSFPADYINFLINFGGSAFEGYVDFCFLDKYSHDERGLLSVFFGVRPGDGYDLMRNYETYRERIPPNFLPIADDPGGNLICLSIDGDDKGSVYFWDHNEEEIPSDGEVAGYSNVYLLARTFSEFINSLQKVEDEEE